MTYSFGLFYSEFLDAFKEGQGYTAWIVSMLAGVTLCSGKSNKRLFSRIISLTLCINLPHHRSNLIGARQSLRLPQGDHCRCISGWCLSDSQRVGEECVYTNLNDWLWHRSGTGSHLFASHCQCHNLLREVPIAGHGNCCLRFGIRNVFVRPADRVPDWCVYVARSFAGDRRYRAQLYSVRSTFPSVGSEETGR